MNATMQCIICFEQFTDLDESPAMATPCGHIHHRHCISGWIRSSSGSERGECPTCRAPVQLSRMVKLYLPGVKISDSQIVQRAKQRAAKAEAERAAAIISKGEMQALIQQREAELRTAMTQQAEAERRIHNLERRIEKERNLTIELHLAGEKIKELQAELKRSRNQNRRYSEYAEVQTLDMQKVNKQSNEYIQKRKKEQEGQDIKNSTTKLTLKQILDSLIELHRVRNNY